jgi:hypothetical protein
LRTIKIGLLQLSAALAFRIHWDPKEIERKLFASAKQDLDMNRMVDPDLLAQIISVPN